MKTVDRQFTTISGVPIEPVYGPGPKVGGAGGTGERAPGEWPGVFPYTRGPYASMYRSKLWTMRMFAGFGTAEDTNARFHDILRAGGEGLSVAYDLPTLMGRDSDDPLCVGEVGRCGVAVDTLADAADLFAGIDLGSTTTSMTINSPAAMCFAMYVSAAEAAGTERKRLGGTLQNDEDIGHAGRATTIESVLEGRPETHPGGGGECVSCSYRYPGVVRHRRRP